MKRKNIWFTHRDVPHTVYPRQVSQITDVATGVRIINENGWEINWVITWNRLIPLSTFKHKMIPLTHFSSNLDLVY